MTSLMLTLAAILIGASLMLVSVAYLDQDVTSAAPTSAEIVSRMGDFAEAVSAYREETGSFPNNVSVVNSVSRMPELPKIDGATWGIAGSSICIIMPDSSRNKIATSNASLRLGLNAVVGDRCGTAAPVPSSVVLSITL